MSDDGWRSASLLFFLSSPFFLFSFLFSLSRLFYLFSPQQNKPTVVKTKVFIPFSFFPPPQGTRVPFSPSPPLLFFFLAKAISRMANHVAPSFFFFPPSPPPSRVRGSERPRTFFFSSSLFFFPLLPLFFDRIERRAKSKQAVWKNAERSIHYDFSPFLSSSFFFFFFFLFFSFFFFPPLVGGRKKALRTTAFPLFSFPFSLFK